MVVLDTYRVVVLLHANCDKSRNVTANAKWDARSRLLQRIPWGNENVLEHDVIDVSYNMSEWKIAKERTGIEWVGKKKEEK